MKVQSSSPKHPHIIVLIVCFGQFSPQPSPWEQKIDTRSPLSVSLTQNPDMLTFSIPDIRAEGSRQGLQVVHITLVWINSCMFGGAPIPCRTSSFMGPRVTGHVRAKVTFGTSWGSASGLLLRLQCPETLDTACLALRSLRLSHRGLDQCVSLWAP